ncbi:MAG TPA: sigma factor [Phycisphaerales bacterium]|nr:sigma factor [Phycisphaerales bacterium]
MAFKEASKCCERFGIDDIDFHLDEAASVALLELSAHPPKFDPSRGARVKTLIYTIVQRAVLKYFGRECRHVSRLKQREETETESGEIMDGVYADPQPGVKEKRPSELTTSGWTTDDILSFIDNEESRKLCRLFIECDGNASEVARRMNLSEGTIRYRLKVLGPKLLAAGFNPFSAGGTP